MDRVLTLLVVFACLAGVVYILTMDKRAARKERREEEAKATAEHDAHIAAEALRVAKEKAEARKAEVRKNFEKYGEFMTDNELDIYYRINGLERKRAEQKNECTQG